MGDWIKTRWYRVLDTNSAVWCETSDYEEALEAMEPGFVLQDCWTRTDEEWRTVMTNDPAARENCDCPSCKYLRKQEAEGHVSDVMKRFAERANVPYKKRETFSPRNEEERGILIRCIEEELATRGLPDSLNAVIMLTDPEHQKTVIAEYEEAIDEGVRQGAKAVEAHRSDCTHPHGSDCGRPSCERCYPGARL